MGGSMMKKYDQMLIIPVTHEEACMVYGGSADKTIVEYIGIGVGYSLKKLWKLFLKYSENLVAQQRVTQVIYK